MWTTSSLHSNGFRSHKKYVSSSDFKSYFLANFFLADVGAFVHWSPILWGECKRSKTGYFPLETLTFACFLLFPRAFSFLGGALHVDWNISNYPSTGQCRRAYTTAPWAYSTREDTAPWPIAPGIYSTSGEQIQRQIQISRECKYKYKYLWRANTNTSTQWKQIQRKIQISSETNTNIQGGAFSICDLLCQPPVPYTPACHSLEREPSSIRFIHFYPFS